jgi:hypothetical protein
MENKLEFLDREHAELMGSLRELSQSKLKTGKAVSNLLAVLEPHFEKEERVVMPLLALAHKLAEGEKVRFDAIPSAVNEIGIEYGRMFTEHVAIRKLAAKAKDAAASDKNSEAVETLDWLSHHAEIEEAIVYPLAMLAAKLFNCSKIQEGSIRRGN